MYKSICRLAACLAALLCLCGAACALAAQDIPQDCLFNGAAANSLKDESYNTVWKSGRKNGVHSLTVEAPQGQTIGGLFIRWHCDPLALTVETQTAGEWQSSLDCEGDFLAQYLPLEGVSAVRLTERDNRGNAQLQISAITVLTPGELPPDVQLWQKPADKVDLMLLSAHPDDEVLWFGGLLPHYAAQRKEVLLVSGCHVRAERRLELLDCLWACGVRSYPVFLGYPDVCSNQRDRVLAVWKHSRVLEELTALYRRYQPDVVVLHDQQGEYGHGAHRVMSHVGREAAEAAADASLFAQSEQAYGVWNVPKVYMHLYGENQLQMDWHVPLDAFGGLTAFEMAARGFQCHRSQQTTGYQMEIGGMYDNSLFGLWRSLVGDDQHKNDLFENIPQ